MKLNVLVIAGTADARQIIKELSELKYNVTATVATTYGKELLKENSVLDIRAGKLNTEEMKRMLKELSAECVVDASHPFAKEVSLNAISSCSELDVPYIRFERTGLDSGLDGIILADDFEAAARKASEYQGNIFLTVGSNNLVSFTKHITDYEKRLFVRVLPDSKVLARCEAIGLNPGNIIAIKGPFSEAINIEMLKYTNASVIVTKDSGETGGTVEKVGAAKRLGIPVIMVRRPDIQYPRVVNTVEGVLGFVKGIAKKGR